ncbi:MAG: hypothetical protein LBL04_05210 [Bacteroidales bacterium]|jgi:hypothetical protein|nr:hypothetical protein [Bacteroidales bacterium]
MAINVFNEPKYDEAGKKALSFIKNQIMPASGQYRLPVSYRISDSLDPLYTLFKKRCWIYDTGLTLLALTTSNDYALCKTIMNRLQNWQNSDGSFNSAYDYDAQSLGPIAKHTGSMGWLVWGMCYYTMLSGDRSYMTMIDNAGTWLIQRQITTTTDVRFGLLRGGYQADGSLIEWCSTENQCSALQALQGLYSVTRDGKYSTAITRLKDWLNPSTSPLYDSINKRFYQGYRLNSSGGIVIDTEWALDCATWAASTALSFFESTQAASDCRQTAYNVYHLEQGITVDDNPYIQGNENPAFNRTYSLNGTAEGFKPFNNNNSPVLIWTEGTLGYVHLCQALGLVSEALSFMDETIKLQNCNGSTGGVIYVTKGFDNAEFQGHVWESIASSAWLYLVINNPNVLFANLDNGIEVIERITETKNWIWPDGVRSLSVYCVGGGGSGAGDYYPAGTSGSGGNGGVVIGAGISANFGGTTIPITVGAGGTGGIRGDGRPGGASSFGIYISAAGGYGGVDTQPDAQAYSGRGGKRGPRTANGYDLQGGDGTGISLFPASIRYKAGAGGAGANSAYHQTSIQQSGGNKGGGNSGYGDDNSSLNRGQDATYYGGGGGGAFSSGHTTSVGGYGYKGIVIIRYIVPKERLIYIYSSKSWTVPAGLKNVNAFCVGGGGSGAGDYYPAGTSGSGGNGGVVLNGLIYGNLGGMTIPITIGAGGVGGIRGDGRPGGNTLFGSFFNAAGGYGGVDTQPDAQTYSGRGGKRGPRTANGYDLQGEDGYLFLGDRYGAGGAGANSAYHQTSVQQSGGNKGGGNSGYGDDNSSLNKGQNATYYGGGGGGGAFSSGHTTSLGGNGRQGVVIIRC